MFEARETEKHKRSEGVERVRSVGMKRRKCEGMIRIRE